MVSSLVIGSETAMLIDMPLTISSAKTVFSSHNHPDHYLSARTILNAFPNARSYANPQAASGIAIGAPGTSAYWSSLLGVSDVVQNTSVPKPFPFSFFALPGDSEYPIHLIQPLTVDTVGEMLFWIPSLRTLIAGDTVYGAELHLFLADVLTPALTASWILTLDFPLDLNPAIVVPRHSLASDSYNGAKYILSTREYLRFWQRELEGKGQNFYTPQALHDSTSALLLNITAENFGRGGIRFGHLQDFTLNDNEEELNGWEL
ncbi:beta-lactamase-like protein [Cadophora sp. MPI-SDFR-AT-0126]|nr:beta-lactamase-like protein [Leotiomycetes sp. MPI-SDFR-AT-0126]